MKCCILFNQPQENALPDELDILHQVEWVENNLRKLGYETYRKGITKDFMSEIPEITIEKPDFVFNLVESINNRGELLYFIPALLNMYGIHYTGNSLEALFITTSKILTVKMLYSAGIHFPESFQLNECRKLIEGKKYIIKPIWEDGSTNITSDSVFTYKQGIESRFSNFRNSHWFIQEYIDGREFNVSLLAGPDGPEMLPPAEMQFIDFGDKPKIVDFKAKWIHDSFEYRNTIREFPGKKLDSMLKDKIEKTALKCWKVFGLKGYARVDIRVDNSNNIYVIEVNANPCISPDSGFVAATREAGYKFTRVLERIIDDIN